MAAKKARLKGQLVLELRTWGGKRRGAGRKATLRPGEKPHRRVRKRPRLSARHPVHVVLRVTRVVGQLRRRKAYQALRRAMITVYQRDVIRIVHLSIQRHHIHLIVEASDEKALARGIQGFEIAAARHLNCAVAVELGLSSPRRGQVFTHRYHAEILDTPRRCRSALAYVINNWRRHREDASGARQRGARVDPYSSGMVFDGWDDRREPFAWPEGYEPLPVVPARTWLLTTAWKRHGLVGLREVPGPLAR